MCRGRYVALLAEGVDRNSLFRHMIPVQGVSPSSRRAWIEIGYYLGTSGVPHVALLAEGVDRNLKGWVI